MSTSKKKTMESFTGRLKYMERVYAGLDSPPVDFYTFLGLMGNPHFALLADTRHEKDGRQHPDYPTDLPFFLEVDETLFCSERRDISDVIDDYKKKEKAYDKENCEYDCCQSSVDWEMWMSEPHPHPCAVVVSSHPFSLYEDIMVTMTSDRKILCKDHPNMVYLDDFDSVYQKMTACPGIL